MTRYTLHKKDEITMKPNFFIDGFIILDEYDVVIYIQKDLEGYFGILENIYGKIITKTPLYKYFEGKLDGRIHIIQINDYILQVKCSSVKTNHKHTLQIINLTNITEYIKQQNSLSTSLNMNTTLNEIINSSYDGIFVTDSVGTGIIVNKAYTRITGVKPQELLGKNIREAVKNGIISDSVTLKVMKEKKSITIIQSVRGKEVLVTGNPIFDETNEITFVITNIRDITDLNRLKMELRKEKALSNQYLNEIDKLKKKKDIELLLKKIVAQSKEIISVLSLALKIANVDSTVILLGESGVGKEVFANIIHSSSNRANEPYIKVNCGAIPPHLLESELFGYEKGAFTGADPRGKPGLFEQANGGTIFLDEIGELPLDLQVKLLRILQESEITRIGGRKTLKVDVRVISATNRDLEKMVEKGEFRKDLYYRLHIIPIYIPPLRARREDITPLIEYFLLKNNKKYGFNKKIHPEVYMILENHDWPGNVREVENLIERLVVTTENDVINSNDIPQTFIKKKKIKPTQTLKEIVQNIESNIIKEQLLIYKTTRKTAAALGLSQSALVKKMKRLDIESK